MKQEGSKKANILCMKDDSLGFLLGCLEDLLLCQSPWPKLSVVDCRSTCMSIDPASHRDRDWKYLGRLI